MRFLSLAARMVVLFLLASYESSLNAIEVGLQANDPQLSLTELQQQQLPWAVLDVAAPRFVRSAQFSLRQMARPGQMYTFPTNAFSLAALRSGHVQAVFSLDQSMRYAAAGASAAVGACDLVVDQSVSLNSAQLTLCMPVTQKGTPFLSAVNKAILSVRASQELTEVCDAVIRAAGDCPIPEASSSGGVVTESTEEGENALEEQVHISSVFGAFIIAGGTLVLAILVHIATAYPLPCLRSCQCCSPGRAVSTRSHAAKRGSSAASASAAYLSLSDSEAASAASLRAPTAVAANPLAVAEAH